LQENKGTILINQTKYKQNSHVRETGTNTNKKKTTRNQKHEHRQTNQHWIENTKEAIKETHTGG